MGYASQVIGWISYVLMWALLLWFCAGLLTGSAMLLYDEWRLHRTRPKPEQVRAYADDLVARHGPDAFRLNGEAMYEARQSGDFKRRRFLREVSGELARRLVAPSESPDSRD